MAHVKISTKENGGYSLTVDDYDLTFIVLAQDFVIDLSGPLPLVHMTIAADSVDLDLPDALVDAVKASSVEVSA